MKFEYLTSDEAREDMVLDVAKYYAKKRKKYLEWLGRFDKERLPEVLEIEAGMLRRDLAAYSWARQIDEVLMSFERVLCFILLICLMMMYNGEFTVAAMQMAFYTVVSVPCVKLLVMLTSAQMKSSISMMTVMSVVRKVKTDETEKLLNSAIDALAAYKLRAITEMESQS